jgi:uncharacterized membrane protein YdjX (TVP38/TMEM64 family)
LRLLPLLPFWLVNLAAALSAVFVFIQTGSSLGAILDSGGSPNVQNLFNPQIKIALLAFAIFALIPVVLKYYRKK